MTLSEREILRNRIRHSVDLRGGIDAVAAAHGISPGLVCIVIDGTRRPTNAQIVALAYILGVAPELAIVQTVPAPSVSWHSTGGAA